MISAIVSIALAVTSANAAGTTPAKPAKPKKVCEKVESTGSAVPKRVCRTVVEPVKPKEEATQAVADAPTAGSTN
ncbi:Putative secreted protein [Sphingopyxis fribergensis]|uniref:Putative secreted protein n=1 Tax=Sphingopyxis fribergensis TaxID=1515612 RepID=A0A0A7PGG8_9SPHN|nr:Putative secreted protein [Sphingopyxis fribergensis]